MQIIKIFCYSNMRSIYCKFSTSKIKQQQPNQKKHINTIYKKTTFAPPPPKNEAKKHFFNFTICLK